MLGKSNALSRVLATKVSQDDEYTDADARAVVNNMVDEPAGPTNELRGEFDAIVGRLDAAEDDLEELTGDKCSTHCRAGQYVKAACTETTETLCETCAQGTFSLGGLEHTCQTCKPYVAQREKGVRWRRRRACGACGAWRWARGARRVALGALWRLAPGAGHFITLGTPHSAHASPPPPPSQVRGGRVRGHRLHGILRHCLCQVQNLQRRRVGGVRLHDQRQPRVQGVLVGRSALRCGGWRRSSATTLSSHKHAHTRPF